MGSLTDPPDACQVVRATGELDLTTVPRFAHELRTIRDVPRPPRLVVDLSAVSFMDGSALDPLCAAWDDCRHRGGWARVVYTRRSVGIVFRAARLGELFPQYLSVQDARRGHVADAPPPREQGAPSGGSA
ncbi:STAS domain-containing protein [Streptomyces sp. SID3212]|uniref:STAS domain-containing protein n=1 Tax=unclassified Streptomyces TaxID=2593676 RepID=UPI0013710AF2|nr:STAS domain-containing protein [Streptomyces sp. SID3212]MYV54496.1 STAS domain-containing protein [Streptomyces sp. SID3212]